MKLTALAGGVGAAKLISGLAKVVSPNDLTVIVNTGDDLRWMGLYICPDLDTITYTLSGLADPVTGWGVRDDTFHCLERLGYLGCETWFRLGDRDLATHIYRTHRLLDGFSLSTTTRCICMQLGITATILPMTNSHVPTLVHTDEGTLGLQDYFVRRSCSPQVRGFSFQGIETASPAPGVLQAIQESDLVVLCPSNPYISIGPILAVPGVREALRTTPAAILAVSPIVAGEAIKGPAAAMMRQLGNKVSAATVAKLYLDFLDIFVLDRRDEKLQEEIAALGLEARALETVMDSAESRVALASSLMELLE